MRKDQCEAAIRSLCHQWRGECGIKNAPPADLSFAEFLSWLRDRHPQYLSFRTTTSVEYDVELWFDQEFRQTWRR